MTKLPQPLPFDPVVRASENWAQNYGEIERMRAVTSLMRVHQLVISGLDDLLKPLGLSFARFEVLVLLSFSRTGALQMRKIGERLQVHATSVTSLVQRLCDAGLIERTTADGDRRAIFARLTDRGHEVLAQAIEVVVAHQFCLSGLSTEQADELADLLIAPRQAAGDFVDDRNRSS